MCSMLNKNQYLLNYRKDVNSQFGEDGIIEKIFELIPASEQNNWCVEFGAWDGKHFSNTYNLIYNKKWHGVLIEGEKERWQMLVENYKGLDRVLAFNRLINFEGKDTLDNVLLETDIPENFDFMSIDIDGLDYHIWDSVKKYKPKVVVIEYNPFIPGNIGFVQEANFKVKHGNSILSITNLAKEKGYELICINQENAFYTDRKYFKYFNIDDNSINALKHFDEPLQVFQLYDGTIRFHGSQSLYYYNLGFDFNKFQVLPKSLRQAHIPWKGTTLFQKILLKLIKILYSVNPVDKEACWSWKSEYKSLINYEDK